MANIVFCILALGVIVAIIYAIHSGRSVKAALKLWTFSASFEAELPVNPDASVREGIRRRGD